MSKENVEKVRAGYAAFSRRDLDAALEYVDPEIEWKQSSAFPDARTFHGHEGVRQFFQMTARWLQLLPDLRIEIKEHIDAGEYVIVPTRLCGHAAGSDADVVVDEVFVNKYRDGRIVEVREYRTLQEALKAVGLSGQDAHADSS